MSSVDEYAGNIDSKNEKYIGGVTSDSKLFLLITRNPNWIFSKQSDIKVSFSVAISASSSNDHSTNALPHLSPILTCVWRLKLKPVAASLLV
jgi:hypothetical protein